MNFRYNAVRNDNTSADLEVSRGALWFGLLGGGVAWMVHFLLAYIIAEFGCLSGWGRTQHLGVTSLAWLLLAISVVALLGAGGAFWVARRSRKALNRFTEAADSGEHSAPIYMARAGVMTNALFGFIILVETLPIFFHLQRC